MCVVTVIEADVGREQPRLELLKAELALEEATAEIKMRARLATLDSQERNPCLMVIFFIICLVLFAEDQGIKKKLKQGKLIVHLRKFPNGNLRMGRVMGVVDAPIDKVWQVITDYNHFKDFMPKISESFMVNPKAVEGINFNEIKDWPKMERMLRKFKLEEIQSDTVYFYNRFDSPWPFSDYYYILKIILSPANYSTHWSMIGGNMEVNDGCWELTPFEDKTLAIYTFCIDPGTPIPPTFLRMGMRITLPDVIKAVRRRVKISAGSKSPPQTRY